MAVTQIKICNLALTRVGADRISSISQETASAQTLNAIWEILRDSVMAAHPWNFATKRAVLTPTSTTPEFEFDYEYDKPSDMLRPLESYTEDVEYVEEGTKLLSNESELDLFYIYRNEDESSWSSNFADALAWRLAQEVAYREAQSLSLQQQCEKSYRASLAEARFVDGTAGRRAKLIADDWTNSRK